MHPELTKLERTFKTSILSKIDDPLFDEYQIELWMKRDDLLHPIVSGNKWRKLKFILDHALSSGTNTIISMGGTYSNHLHALAYVGKTLGLKTTGLIRGERPEKLTPALSDMQNWDMVLKFVARSDYRLLRQYKGIYDLPGLKPQQYWLPEGGAQVLALKGVAELVNEIDVPYDIICAPCGTGATLAGIIDTVPEQASVIGFAALKNAGFLHSDVESLLPRPCINWRINHNYHFGGFAKTSNALTAFIADFEFKTGIPLEPVYTGKMMYALYDLITKHTFKPGHRIIAIHTGGLQGNRGFSS